MGNGDIGVVAGDTTTPQRFYFGKSDFWGTHWNVGHNAPEVSIISLGSLTPVSLASQDLQPSELRDRCGTLTNF